MEYKESISSFAFFTGREIERIINQETNNLVETNRLLEGLILSYRANIIKNVTGILRDYMLKDYDKHFNITNSRDGK